MVKKYYSKEPGKLQILLERLADWYSEQSGAVRGVIFPLFIAVANLLAVKFVNFKSLIGLEPFSVISLTAILGFLLVNGFSATIGYLNSEDLKSVRLQNDLLSKHIRNLDNTVATKRKALCEALVNSTPGIPHELIVNAYEKIDFNKSITELMANLFETVEHHLRDDGWLSKSGGCHLAYLEPNENEAFRVVGIPSVSSNTSRTVPRVTSIKLNDVKAMGARLWRSTSTSVMSARSTTEAEDKDEFVFQDDDERSVVRSIFIWRVDNPITHAPIGILSIDANEENVFPDKDEVARRSALEGLFRSYGERVKLEWVYSEILNKTEPVLAAGVKILSHNGDKA